MTEYPGITPAELPNYPMLSTSDKMPVAYHEPVAPPVEEETQRLLDEPKDEEPDVSVSTARRLGRAVKDKFKSLKSESTSASDVPPAFNPEPPTQLTGLAKLVAEKSAIHALLLNGFSVDKMYENGIGLDTFYDAGYNLREVNQLFPEWQQLLDAGFNKAYLGEQWHIDQLVILYGNQAFRKVDICRALKFTIDDFMKARTVKEQYAELGIDGAMLVAMQVDFEHLFAMHLPFEQFVDEFRVTKDDVLRMRDHITKHQAQALALTRGWNMVALEEKLGMTDEEIRMFGVALES